MNLQASLFCLVYIILQNYRMWFKYGLKSQKLLAQGIALGTRQQLAMRPVRAKALYFVWYMKAFALTGRQTCVKKFCKESIAGNKESLRTLIILDEIPCDRSSCHHRPASP